MLNKKIAILGSTGSIGRQTLDVARHLGLRVVALTVGDNIELLQEQIEEFKPEYCAMKKPQKLNNVKVLRDSEEVAATTDADIVVNAIMGSAGLRPTLAAIRNKRTIALANKETLVTAGEIIMREAKQNSVQIIPVDSEHSAIFQSLDTHNSIKRILLTCSGGPFYGRKDLDNITVADALKHPTWKMGPKITIDCATLMNKGLEVIEAVRLFGVDSAQVEVLIHRESIIHSMVEYIDNAVIAQLSVPDMRLCIQYALTYPERHKSQVPPLDFAKLGSLTFNKPDTETFTLLPLAYNAIVQGGIVPAVLNGANEYAVELFLTGKIKFTDIFDLVENAVTNCRNVADPTIEDIEAAEIWAREFVGDAALGVPHDNSKGSK